MHAPLVGNHEGDVFIAVTTNKGKKTQQRCMEILVSPMPGRICVVQQFQFDVQLVDVMCRAQGDFVFAESDELPTHSGHSRHETRTLRLESVATLTKGVGEALERLC